MQIVTVSFPVTGSHELFHYRANGGSFTLRDIHTPSYNEISMDIEMQTLDKAQAFAEAEKELEATRQLIAQNNFDIERWSQYMSEQIESMAAQKRKELLDLYS